MKYLHFSFRNLKHILKSKYNNTDFFLLYLKAQNSLESAFRYKCFWDHLLPLLFPIHTSYPASARRKPGYCWEDWKSRYCQLQTDHAASTQLVFGLKRSKENGFKQQSLLESTTQVFKAPAIVRIV